jgi:hypothetical protein
MSSSAQQFCAYNVSCSASSASTPWVRAFFARALSSCSKWRVSPGSTSFKRNERPSVTLKCLATFRALAKVLSFIVSLFAARQRTRCNAFERWTNPTPASRAYC